MTFTSSFSFFLALAAALTEAGGGADGSGTDEGDTGPVSGMVSAKDYHLHI